MKNILFVCTGNTCRSSMAEGILKGIVTNLGILRKYSIRSAGTSVYESESANHKAIEVMKEMEIDISEHKSQALALELIHNADIILTMTKVHKARVLEIFPSSINKTYTIKELANNKQELNVDMSKLSILEEMSDDISDPYGKSLSEYRKTAQEIREALEKIIKDKNI